MSDMGEGSQYAHDQDTIARLRAEVAALKADAERYRRLRGSGAIIDRSAPGHLFCYGIGLDAAVDEALKDGS